MSWITRLNNNLIITCGEGSEFRPKWINAVKAREFNITEFNFPDVSGTLVKRQQPKGNKYNLEIYFEGENHIDESKAFEIASDDPRAWIISHPYYDRLTVQPVSMTIDNTKYNSTKIIVSLIETITDENPKTTVDPLDKIIADHEELNVVFEQEYANDIDLDVNDINQMSDNLNDLFNEGQKIISENLDFENYFNLFNEASTAINNAISLPLTAIRTLQAVINAPSQFLTGVKSRLQTLKTQFEKLKLSIGIGSKKSLKKLYENNSGVLISTMALSLITNSIKNEVRNDEETEIPKISTRTEIVFLIGELLDSYNDYLATIDTLQSDNANSINSYIPNYKAQRELNDLVNFTVSNLFQIAINSRQERTIILEDDDNMINLTHRFYGLDVNDENLDEFISTNNIGLNEYLNIKKGRLITYFV